MSPPQQWRSGAPKSPPDLDGDDTAAAIDKHVGGTTSVGTSIRAVSMLASLSNAVGMSHSHCTQRRVQAQGTDTSGVLVVDKILSAPPRLRH